MKPRGLNVNMCKP